MKLTDIRIRKTLTEGKMRAVVSITPVSYTHLDVYKRQVHRLLETEYRGGALPGFRRNEKNPLDVDVVIVDEASMLDVMLCDALLRAVPAGARMLSLIHI